MLLPYEKWKKGDELQPVPKKRKKRKPLNIPLKSDVEVKPANKLDENIKPEIKTEVEDDEVKEEVKASTVVAKSDVVKVKSEEIGRKEEVQNRAMIIKQELENMKIRKVSKYSLYTALTNFNANYFVKCNVNTLGRWYNT